MSVGRQGDQPFKIAVWTLVSVFPRFDCRSERFSLEAELTFSRFTFTPDDQGLAITSLKGGIQTSVHNFWTLSRRAALDCVSLRKAACPPA